MFLLSYNFVSLFGQEAAAITDTAKVTQTLFSKVRIHNMGLYVAPEFTYGQYASAFAPQGGMSALISFNGKFAIGGNVTHTLGRNFTPDKLSANNTLAMQARTVGLRMEYAFSPHRLIHFTIPLTIGAGGANVDSVGSFDFRERGRDGFNNGARTGVGFMFIQPGINVEVNLFKYARFFAGVNYRLATNLFHDNTNPYNITPGQLSGMGINAGLKLGIFDYSCKKKTKQSTPS